MPHAVSPVVELIRTRLAEGSRPGARTDAERLAVVIEGGSSRAAYGGGMVCELESRGVLRTFDAVYGASAGALNGAWLVCGRANDNVHGWWEPEVMREVINPRRMLRGHPLVDTDYLISHVYEHLTPMGWSEILASDVEYHPLATDAQTGESVDLRPMIHDKLDLQTALRATSRMPILGGPPVRLGDRSFIDAGIAEPIPVYTAQAQGATHLLVLRTKTPSFEPHRSSKVEQRVVTRWMRRHAPGAVVAWADRDVHRIDTENTLAVDPRVIQLFPPEGSPTISRVGRSAETLEQAVDIGRQVVAAALDA